MRTSALGVASSVVSGATLFIVFRVGIELVGAALVGSWVMIQSAYIIARLPEAGVGINVTRLVKIESQEGPPHVWHFFGAGLLLSVIPILLIGLLLLEPVVWLLKVYFESAADYATLYLLAGLSLATALLGATAAVALSIVEGLGGLARRHYATLAANVVMGASVYPLVKTFGVVGIGLSYCVYGMGLCAGGLLLLLRAGARQPHPEPLSPNGPGAADTLSSITKRLWRQNFVVSGMALMGMSYEPWTKFLVTSAGGLAAVAYLDLAMKVTLQLRIAIQAASQPLLSLGARQDLDLAAAHGGFDRAHELVIKSNLFLITLQVAAAPFVSYLGLGSVSGEFMLFYLVLTVGNAINSLGVVGYYYDASGGNLGRLFRINMAMMVLNLLLGAAGTILFGAAGAALAYALSFAYGGIVLSTSWMTASRRRWSEDLRKEGGAVALAVAAIGLAIPLYGGLATRVDDWIAASISGLLATALLVLFVGRHWRAYV